MTVRSSHWAVDILVKLGYAGGLSSFKEPILVKHMTHQQLLKRYTITPQT